MSSTRRGRESARSLLEQLIWERFETVEGFIEYADRFTAEHKDVGTLTLRHALRLVSGHRGDGRPLGRPRLGTVRLLERIFGVPVDRLLAPPPAAHAADTPSVELQQMLSASRRVDRSVVRLLREQLDAVRRLDRQLGAVVAQQEVRAKIDQVRALLAFSLSPAVRTDLAALLSELSTLAGWQALDLGDVDQSWALYESGKSAAAVSGSASFIAHTTAEQAFVLIDIGRPSDAVELLTYACDTADNAAPALLRAWLAAAQGEALAADNRRSESLRLFDQADALLPDDTTSDGGPFVVLDSTHLARWRGHALSRVGDSEAISVLSDALGRLDPTFTRAETGLRVDLAMAFAAAGERDEARHHARVARDLATEIGSARQRRRMARLEAELSR